MNSASYLTMFQNVAFTEVMHCPKAQEMTFMQYGAPQHFSIPARNGLDINFPNRWIGRHGPTEAYKEP